MTVKSFLADRLHAVQKRGIEWESKAIWQISDLRDSVPEGKCENHPNDKGIALLFALDDGRVIVVGDPLDGDRIKLQTVVDIDSKG